MNLQQLEYIIAVDEQRHFARAAGKSFITQPTLSMMIQKLEEELGLKIFDRSRQPVVPTREGEEIIRRARAIMAQVTHLKDYGKELKGEMSGELRLGIIPTLAPYLLPLFLRSFHTKHPGLRIFIKEMITEQILSSLRAGDIDLGLCAIPIQEPGLMEVPLFNEEFFVYASRHEKLPKKKYLLPKEINVNHLWLLEEGHCLRNQVFNLCELKKKDTTALNYEAGSIETLINLVDQDEGITIIPRLAELNLKPAQRKKVREFANPRPAREIGLVAAEHFPRQQVLQLLKDHIMDCLPAELVQKRRLQPLAPL